jgi:hypothetical protein
LWAYLEFSQFLVIWSGNVPMETSWYGKRLRAGWQWLEVGIVVLHFAVPFFLLLSRDVKRNLQTMSAIAACLLAMHWADLYWIAGPAMRRAGFRIQWPDVTAMIGLGGIWIWGFTKSYLPLAKEG